MSDFNPKKRKADSDPSGALVLHKKVKKEETKDTKYTQIVLRDGPKRTSQLKAPIMILSGHKSDIYSTKFSPNGEALASGSRDKEIFLWKVYGDCVNYACLKGHRNAVLEVAWTPDSELVLSASADKTTGVWDAHTGKRKNKFVGHESYVNSVSAARKSNQLFASGSDDACAKLWDIRAAQCTTHLQHNFEVTAVALNEDRNELFTGSLDNEIRLFDLRNPMEPMYKLSGHTDTITCLRLDPFGSYLLSNSFDSAVRLWDIGPFAKNPNQRCIKVFSGATHNATEKNLIKSSWSYNGAMISSGSADKAVYVWDTTTRKISYRLGGHDGCVNETDFHPKEPIIASCGNDRQIFLGELDE